MSADDLPAGKAGPRPRRSPDGVAGPQQGGGRYAAGHFLPDGCVRRVTRFRSDALRWAVATFGDHAEYRFNQTEGGVQYQGIEVGWLPEGYELVESDVTNRTISQFYTRSSGGTEQSIEIQVMDFAGEGIFKVDTEADELYQVIVQNTLATVIERGSRIQITWMHPKFNCIVMLYSDNISAETALRIAQSIVLS